MKPNKTILLIVLLSLSLIIGCSQSVTSDKIGQKIEKKILTAAEVLDGLKSAGLPIGNAVEYTAETDTNKLLGRPGQYTGKANFEDTRIDEDTQYLDDSIEVFANDQDLQNRNDYTKELSSKIPLLAQYAYIYKNVLLRLDHALTPAQAAEYEKALLSL